MTTHPVYPSPIRLFFVFPPSFIGATRIFFFPNETVMFSRAMIAELDVEHDESIDLATVHAEPVPPVVY